MPTDHSRDDRRADPHKPDIDRRTFIAAGGTVGATLMAGCASESDPTDDATDDSTDDDSSPESIDDETTDDSRTKGGNFRLLISDRPAAIGDFDRLDVSFDDARIFDGGGEESGGDEGDKESDDGEGEIDDGDDSTQTDDTDGEDEENVTDEESSTDEEEGTDDESSAEDAADTDEATDDEAADDEADGVERRRGFYWLDLEGATVDLTQVVGEKAISVFEGGLSPGTYQKIELHVADVEGVVDGEVVDVKVPSEKLQIPLAFEVTEDEPLEFVFDINVVKKGNGGYNLLPVISESGVAGTDVDVEEVDGDGEDDDEAGDDGEDGSDTADEGGESDGETGDGNESESNA